MSLRCVARATVGMSQKNVATSVDTSAVGVNQYVTAVCEVRTVGVRKNVTAKWSPDCIALDACESRDELVQAACHTTTLLHHEMS
jgi:hypothetical protein